MNATRKVKLKDLTVNLSCKLCMGYLVDATTIIECLHSFCKSCIVKYLEKTADLEEKYCPVCDVQLHSTKPFTSIRSDLMLQEIVYKLVPGLFKNEMSRRRKFYEKSPIHKSSNQLDSGQVFNELYITSDDVVHVSLEYVTNDVQFKENSRRYLKCPAAVSVFILKKFIHGKYDLPVETIIDLMFGDRILPDDFLLMDILYKYSWTYNGSKPLTLRYRIKGLAKKPKIKSDLTINDAASASQDNLTSPITKKKVCNENGSNIMPTAPEDKDIKSNPIRFNGNVIISREIPILPIKTPSGKVRGRKRKHLNYSDIVIENPEDVKRLAKRLKLPKVVSKPKPQVNAMVQSSTQVEIDKTSSSDTRKEMNEIQLQISENGEMSLKCGSSQRNKSPEKLLLSGNFHSKAGPTGVTEIICDKPDPTFEGLKTSTAKPGYVTLNIPNPNSALSSQPSFRYRSIHTDCNQLRKDSSSKIEQKGESPSQLIPNGNIYSKTKSNGIRMSTVEKIRNRIAAKRKDGKNVMKAMTALEKLSKGFGGYNNATSNIESQSTPQKSSPIVATLNNNSLHKQTRPYSNCRGSKIPLPLPVNFSPSSGMSVSIYSTASTHSSTSTSTSTASTIPPGRLSHQATGVNRDSPKQFNSSSKQESDMGRKTPTPNGNRPEEPLQKKIKEQSSLGLRSQMQNLTGMLINGSPSMKPLMHSVIPTDTYSQHLSALSSLTGNFSESSSSNLGIALNATNGMVPSVNNSYCFMPFPNPMSQFGFPYSNLVTNANALQINFANRSPAPALKSDSASIDLTVAKSGNNNSEATPSPQKEPSSTSLLAKLLNPMSPERNPGSNKREVSKTPVNTILNGGHHSPNPSPTFSNSPRSESNKINGGAQTSNRYSPDGRNMMDGTKPASSNGNEDRSEISSFSKISHKLNLETVSKSENSKDEDKEWIRNGSTEQVEKTSSSADAKLSLTAQNNNNLTVSSSYGSSDSTSKALEETNCAKLTNGDTNASSSSKCDSA